MFSQTAVVLCDAQTSGGMLISIAPSNARKLEEALERRGVAWVAQMGRITGKDEQGRVRVVR